MKKIHIAITVYSIIAFATFGRAWRDMPIDVSQDGGLAKVIGSTFASAAWPLYWSIKLWEPPIKEKH